MGLGASAGGELPGQSAPPPFHSLASPALALGVEQDGTTLYLRLTGEFDHASVRRVDAAFERAAAHVRRVVFDLRGVSFLDLAGLKTILRAQERSCSEQFDVVVVKPRGLISRIFTLTRAGERLTLVDQPPQPGRS